MSSNFYGAFQVSDLTGVTAQRWVSYQLKLLGFRYGAPIERATAEFTIDQAWTNLRYGTEFSLLTFTVADGSTLQMALLSIHTFVCTGPDDFLEDLFGEKAARRRSQDCFILHGLLWDPEAGTVYTGLGDFAQSAAYGAAQDWEYGMAAHSDRDLKTHALVYCDPDGTIIDALVQRVPSPADQMLSIPPPAPAG